MQVGGEDEKALLRLPYIYIQEISTVSSSALSLKTSEGSLMSALNNEFQ